MKIENVIICVVLDTYYYSDGGNGCLVDECK